MTKVTLFHGDPPMGFILERRRPIKIFFKIIIVGKDNGSFTSPCSFGIRYFNILYFVDYFLVKNLLKLAAVVKSEK